MRGEIGIMEYRVDHRPSRGKLKFVCSGTNFVFYLEGAKAFVIKLLGGVIQR